MTANHWVKKDSILTLIQDLILKKVIRVCLKNYKNRCQKATKGLTFPKKPFFYPLNYYQASQMYLNSGQNAFKPKNKQNWFYHFQYLLLNSKIFLKLT